MSNPTRRVLMSAAITLPMTMGGAIHQPHGGGCSADADLFRLCAAAHAANAVVQRYNETFPHRVLTDAKSDAEDAAWHEACCLQKSAFAAVVAMPTRTLAVIRAKAAVTADALDDGVREIQKWTFEDQASDHDMLVRSLVQDIMRLVESAVA